MATEELNAPLEQSGLVTGKYSLGFYDTSQFASLVEAAAGSDLKLLRFPSQTGRPGDHKMEVRSSMYWIVPARSKHADTAKKLVDYLANSAGSHPLGDRGVPTNTDVRASVRTKLDPSTLESVRFIEELTPEARDFVPRAPVGGGSIEDVLNRQTSDVLFGRATPSEAAQRLIDEARTATQK